MESILELFLRATVIVQLVMVLLVLASFWSWAIVAGKMIGYATVKRESGMFENAFWSGQPLEELYARVGDRPRSAMERIFCAGMQEWRKSQSRGGELIPGALSRIERAMSVAINRESELLEAKLGYLATVGAITPFVGLFGTVWGIMNSFSAIAEQQNTNLAVVAPGISEALLATALGLFAAIPAVIFYNNLSGDAERLIGRMEKFYER